jgi:hypothetical protein
MSITLTDLVLRSKSTREKFHEWMGRDEEEEEEEEGIPKHGERDGRAVKTQRKENK